MFDEHAAVGAFGVLGGDYDRTPVQTLASSRRIFVSLGITSLSH